LARPLERMGLKHAAHRASRKRSFFELPAQQMGTYLLCMANSFISLVKT
jgi:hypothetical protein